MMEEQLERVRGETKAVGEAVGRAREVIEALGKENPEGVGEGVEMDRVQGSLSQGRRKDELVEKRVWEVSEREVGRI